MRCRCRTLNNIINAEAQLKFEVVPGKRSAYLIMDGFQVISLPDQGLLKRLAKAGALKRTWLVTSVKVCTAYTLGLTSKGMTTMRRTLTLVHTSPCYPGSTSISAGFGASSPLPFAPLVQAGGTVSAGWSTTATTTFQSSGSRLEGAQTYTTLLTLKVMSAPWLAWCFGERRLRIPLYEPADKDV